MKKNSLKIFLKKYAFYMVLAVCVLGVGGTIVASVRKINNPPVAPKQLITTTALNNELNVDVTMQGIKKEEPTTTEQTTEEETTQKAPEMTTTTHVPTTQSEQALNASAGKPFESYFMQPIGNGTLKKFSNFELVYSQTMQDWRTHDGVDLKGDKGMAVRSMTSGTVLNVYEDQLLGVVVEINHGNGLIARYCGLEKNPPVQVNSPVEMGDIIGLIGEIPVESLEQSHVHIETELNGTLIDPETLFS